MIGLSPTATPCPHGWPRDGWPCPYRRCIDTARAAYAEAILQAAIAETENAARTPEDHLVDALRAVWANHPTQRDLIGALVEYAQVKAGRQVTL